MLLFSFTTQTTLTFMFHCLKVGEEMVTVSGMWALFPDQTSPPIAF